MFTRFPTWMAVALTQSIVPDELAAPIVGNGKLIVANAVAFMVEELAFPGSPADLHNPRGDNEGLVEPNTRVHLECAAYALKG